jgi:hypothetical protein
MSESILNIAGIELILPDEDALTIYKIFKERGTLFSEYAASIDSILLPLSEFGNLRLTPAPKNIAKNVAAAKAIGASYHDFMRKQPK